MGKKKIEIKKIESLKVRRVTFSKRRTGLLNKAREVSTLGNADVAIIIFAESGKLYEFSSTSMEQILSRSTRNFDLNLPYTHSPPNPMEESSLNAFREELATLRTSCMRMRGEELQGLSYDELQQLEYQIAQGINLVCQKIQEQLLVELESSRFQEHLATLENETLPKQVEELQQGVLVSAPPCMTYRSMEPGFFKPNPDVTEEGKHEEEQINSLNSGLLSKVTTIEETSSSDSAS